MTAQRQLDRNDAVAVPPAERLARLASSSAAPVGLLNVYSTRNLGDAAIMTAIAEMVPGGRAATVVGDREPLDVAGLSYLPGLEICDRFISVGGDIFNNARPRFLTRNFMNNVWQLASRGRNAMVFGQTIPSSCRGVSLELLAAALRRTAAVVVRDRESHRLLRAKGVDAELSFDAALALSPTPVDLAEAHRFLGEHEIDAQSCALLSVRPFDHLYPEDEDRFVIRMARLAAQLADRGHQVAVPIQAAVSSADGDYEMARRIRELEPRVSILDLITHPCTGTTRVGRLIGLMAIARIVVAVRYHAAVLRLAAGRQPYHLYYSRKGRDLSERLGLPGSSLGAIEPDADVAQIERTASKTFNVRPLEADVREKFATALGRLS